MQGDTPLGMADTGHIVPNTVGQKRPKGWQVFVGLVPLAHVHSSLSLASMGMDTRCIIENTRDLFPFGRGRHLLQAVQDTKATPAYPSYDFTGFHVLVDWGALRW